MGRSQKLQEILDSYSEVEDLETLLSWAEELKGQIKEENHPQAEQACNLIQILTGEAKRDERLGRDYSPEGVAFDIVKEVVIGYNI